jgi:glucose-6-phosphate isomerase
MEKYLPYDLPLQSQIDLLSGEFSPCGEFYERRLSQLVGQFADPQAGAGILASEDRLLYDVRIRSFITSLSDLTMAVVRLYPGKIGDEYHFTKGHAHLLLEEPELDLCLSGQGCLLLENGEGDFQNHWWSPGAVSHIPPGYAHRVANTGDEMLVYAAIYRLSAGHDYERVARQGFLHRVIELEGQPALI